MERGEGVLAHGLDGGLKESPRSGKPRAKLWCPRGRSCSRVDTALRGEVGAGRRRVPTVATSLPRSEPSRRLREARWQRSVFAKNDTNLGRLTRSCLDTFPASREMAISKTFFARPTAIVVSFIRTPPFSMRFFRLTLAHRCRLCQRRSPSHHLMAEAPASPSLSGAKRPRFHRLARGNVCLTKSRSATVNRDQSATMTPT